MNDMWAKIEAEEKAIYELEVVKSETLGRLLGVVDTMALAKLHSDVFKLDEVLDNLIAARDAFDAAEKAFRVARQAAFDARKLKAAE